MKFRAFILTIACSWLLPAASSFADTFTLTPGPDTSKDVWAASSYNNVPDRYSIFPGNGTLSSIIQIGGWGDTYKSLLQFDLSTLPAAASSAVLRLYDTTSGLSPTDVIVSRNTTPWDLTNQPAGSISPQAVTVMWWSNLPSTADASAPLPAPTAGSYFTIDITSFYNGWKSGAFANYGITLSPASTWNNWDQFASSRDPNPDLRPTLIVTTVPEPEVYAMMLAGLSLMGLFASRRRRTLPKSHTT